MRPRAPTFSPALALLIAGLAPAMAWADSALVLANESYATLPDLAGGDAPARATGGIATLGFQVTALADGGREDTARALARVMAQAPDAERLVVALSGRFATDGDRSWFLTADSPAPTLFGLNSNAVSVESVLAVLARRPSHALLLLGLDPEVQGAFDPWLREGLGDLDIPQGVTVLLAEPDIIADFMTHEMSRPGADLAALAQARDGVRAEGYLPAGFRFMPDAPEAPTPPVVEVPDPASPAEIALWQGAQALGTVEAYRNYQRVYPEGAYATAARDAVATILAEPDRAARLAEESLRLTRQTRAEVQRNLAALDFDPRGIDGVWGAGTRSAIVNWQQQNGFAQTSYVDAEQIERLAAQAAERASEGERQRQAALAADDAAWDGTGGRGTEAGLRAYLQRYPEGRHAEEAADALALIARAAREEAARQDEERRQADARRAAEAERGAWETAREADTGRAYAAYLEAYPDGRHAAEALDRRIRLAADNQAARATRAAGEAAEAALDLSPLTARVIEARLASLGIDPGPVDGTFNGRTREALRTFQTGRDLPATGYLDQPTLIRLLADTLGRSLGD